MFIDLTTGMVYDQRQYLYIHEHRSHNRYVIRSKTILLSMFIDLTTGMVYDQR